MSNITLQFRFRVNGVLTNATSVVLSDPDGTYGVKRTDTNGVVVADGTAMTSASTGVYNYTFTPPASGLTYSWFAEVTYSGSTFRFEQETVDPNGAGTAAGYYATQTDLETRFGATNVAAWSNVSGNLTEANETTIQAALDDSDLAIDEMLRMNGFATPVATTSVDFPRMTDIACELAIAKLMDTRLLRNDPPDGMGREMFFKVKRARGRLKSLILGGLSCSRLADGVNGANGRQPQAL